jgi:hypothetical protein
MTQKVIGKGLAKPIYEVRFRDFHGIQFAGFGGTGDTLRANPPLPMAQLVQSVTDVDLSLSLSLSLHAAR